VADRETLLVLTASDEAIQQSRHLGTVLTPPKTATVPDLGVMYIAQGAPAPGYVDDDDDVVRVSGPVELEADMGAYGRACLPSGEWGDAA